MNAKLRTDPPLWNSVNTESCKIVEATGNIHFVYSLGKY